MALSSGQLQIALLVAFGTNRRGHLNVTAAAERLRVAPSTVRRWLHERLDGTAAIPQARLAQVRQLVGPTPETRAAQAEVVRNATTALTTLARSRGRVLKHWREQDWLAPYVVAIVEPGKLPIQQVTVSRRSSKSLEHLRRRGRLVDEVEVPTKFAAIVLAHAVLDRVEPWRVEVPRGWNIDGRTQSWIPGAVVPPLAMLADELGLAPTPQTAKRKARR